MDIDAWEERSAIMEYDGGLSRFQAETLSAQARGKKRWEAMDAIKNRTAEQQRHQCEALAFQSGANDMPGMQPHPAKENRPMSERVGNG